MRIGRTDTDADRVALFSLWPGLNVVAHRYCRRWDYDDTAAEVIAAALERIASYPMHRTSSPAANIVLHVRNRLHTFRRRAEALSEVIGATLDVDAAACVPTAAQPGSAAEHAALLREGTEAGSVTRRGAEPIMSSAASGGGQ